AAHGLAARDAAARARGQRSPRAARAARPRRARRARAGCAARGDRRTRAARGGGPGAPARGAGRARRRCPGPRAPPAGRAGRRAGVRGPCRLAGFGRRGGAYARAVMELETRTPARAQPVLPAGDENLQVLGFAAAREPIQAVQLLYSGRSLVAPLRWAPADELARLTRNAAAAIPAGWRRYVSRASIPRADVPPEHVGLRVRIVTASLQVLESDALYSLQPSSTEPMLFPARPAPAPAQGGVQLVLLGGCLLLALLA